MGCRKVGHDHRWPETGRLIIQSCERRRNSCALDGVKKKLSSATSLREHVRAIHIKKGPYRKLVVSDLRDEERAASEPPEKRGQAHVRAVLAKLPKSGLSKRQREASVDSIDSEAYSGFNADIKNEKDERASVNTGSCVASASTPKKRRKTTDAKSPKPANSSFSPRRTSSEEEEDIPASEECVRRSVEKMSQPASAKEERDEYVFMTLAKARTSAPIFSPALQEVVHGDFDSIFMKPETLASRIIQNCSRLERGGAKPGRVDHVRSSICSELRVRMDNLFSSLLPEGCEKSALLTPPSSSVTTPRSLDNRASPESPLPQLRAAEVSGLGESQARGPTSKPPKGKLKRFKKGLSTAAAITKDQSHDASPRTMTKPSCLTPIVPSSTTTPGSSVALAQPVHKRNEYWSYPRAIPWPETDPRPPHRTVAVVLLPFGTPSVPLRGVLLTEVQDACSRAFGKDLGLEMVSPWGPTLFVAMFPTWAQAKALFHVEIQIRNVTLRTKYLPKNPARTFRASLPATDQESLNRITKAVFDFVDKTFPWNLPELCIQRHHLDERLGCRLIAYFRAAPRIVEMHIPVPDTTEGEPTMVSFVPMDLVELCWQCRVKHMYDRCERTELVEQTRAARPKRSIQEAAISAKKQ